MNPDDIFKLDFRKEQDREFAQKALRKFKSCRVYPMGQDVPFAAIEELLSSMMLKYAIDPLDFFIVKQDGNETHVVWSCGVKKLDGHAWLGTAYGLTLYEVVSKVLLFVFLHIRKGNIGLRKR